MVTGRLACAVLGALLGAFAWAQSDKLDLRLPKDDAPGPGALCKVCGEVRSVREVHVGLTEGVRNYMPTEYIGSQTGIEASKTLVVGAAIVLPLGGPPSEQRWRMGTAGTPEAQARLGEYSYEITVKMDGGETRTIQRRDGARFRVGQRVTLRSGELEPAY
jgi:hypothetical protein